MKKLGLMAAGFLLSMGLIAYAASSGEVRKSQDGCKAACDQTACSETACEKSSCDTSSCRIVCEPSSCLPRIK